MIDGSSVCNVTAVKGTWQYRFVVGGEVLYALKHGTTKRYQELNTTDWIKSVSIVAESSLLIFDSYQSIISVDQKFREHFSKTYVNEWSLSEEDIWTVEIKADDHGKALWQFVLTIEDDCDHQVQTYLQEYALTTSEDEPPCCLPGYSTDGSYYTNCNTEEELIEKQSSHCVVAEKKSTKNFVKSLDTI